MKRVSVIILLSLAMLFTLMSACFPKASENIQTPQVSITPNLPVTTPPSSIRTYTPLPTRGDPAQVSVPAELIIPIENLIAKESAFIPENQTWSEETKILKLILANLEIPPKYAVIEPQTINPLHWHSTKNQDIEKARMSYINFFKSHGYDFTNLVNQLMDKNRESHPLTINSSLENGYFIDYTNHFDKFLYMKSEDLKYGGENFDMWHKAYPDAHRIVRVSLPAYDAEKGYVMVYIYSIDNWLFPSGIIYVYKYESDQWPYNKLKYIIELSTFIS
jgi:hypothetical protein